MSKKKSVNPVLVELAGGDVLVRYLDERNVFVERKETKMNHKTKTQVTNYRLKGYYASVYQALEAIFERGWLNDDKEKTTIGELIEQINYSRNEIISAIERVEDSNETR